MAEPRHGGELPFVRAETGVRALPNVLDGVLFDLDGTLVDSAADLHAALAVYCAEVRAAVPPYAAVRAVVSRGSRAILRCAFAEDDAALAPRVARYLAIYRDMLATRTRPFAGIAKLLGAMEGAGLRWGIVTNKPGFLADELVRRLGWGTRAAAVVSGDTLPVKKPDPAPVLLACERAGVRPAHGVFVGDDARDVEASHAAGMFAIAVEWGYLNDEDPHAWGADAVVATPPALARLLGLGVAA